MRQGLGQNAEEDDNGQLSLDGLGELIRRAGRESGFTVWSEFHVKVPNERYPKKVDWIWLHDNQPVMAFEIEGLDVPDGSLEGDKKKFENLPDSCGKVTALYSIRKDRTLSRSINRITVQNWVNQSWTPRNQHDTWVVKFDTELFSAGGIEQLQKEALRRRKNLRQTKK